MKDNMELGVLIDPIKCDQYDLQNKHASWRFGLVRVKESDEVCNVTDGPYEDLQFYSHLTWAYNNRLEATFFELSYRSPYEVNLQTAEMMLKMLKRIERIKKELPVTGLTFPQWVVLMAGALGIKKAVKLQGQARGWHSDNSYYIGPLKEVQGIMERELDELRRKVLPTEQEQAEAAA